MKCAIFENVLNQINDDKIRNFTTSVLNSLSEEFYRIPASKTGKYHHQDSLGEGGLVRHVLRACYFGKIMIDSQKWDADDIKGDMLLSGIILHDIGKKEHYEASSYLNHPITAMKISEKFKDILPEKHFALISGCILHHMGPWTPPSVKKPMNRYNILELLTYQSDYLSSKKEIDINQKG